MSVPFKLGFSAASSRRPALSSLSSACQLANDNVGQQASNSARVAEAERTIANLENENTMLKTELSELRAMYRQLTMEGCHETFDERRVTLLKSQIIQLERQILLLTEALGNRSSILMDAENSLAAAVEFCRSFLIQKNSGGDVRLPREDLERLVRTLDASRVRLYDTANVTSTPQNLTCPLIWFGHFIKNRPGHPVTILDICSGGIEHINLKHVGRLESKLVQLYKELMVVGSALQICVRSVHEPSTVPDTPTAVYNRLLRHVNRSCDQLQDVCTQLLHLSVLVPAAPLPALDRSAFSELTVENIMQQLRKSSAARDRKALVEALVKCTNYTVSQAGCERNLLLSELEFHRAVYEHQSDYIDSLFACVRKEYSVFESELRDQVCRPLTAIMSAFGELKGSTNEVSLLRFIDAFKNHADMLSETLERLIGGLPCHGKERNFFEYENDFCRRLDHCRMECRKKRDMHINEIDIVKQQLAEQTKELVKMLKTESSEEVFSAAVGHSVHSEQTRDSPCVDDDTNYKTPGVVTDQLKHADCSGCSEDNLKQSIEGTSSRKDTSRRPSDSTVRFVRSKSNLVLSSTDDTPPSAPRIKSVPGIAQRTLSLRVRKNSSQEIDNGSVKSSGKSAVRTQRPTVKSTSSSNNVGVRKFIR